ncbi:MAG: DUF1292 domain-containing protein [Lachnospiraceae bacterium]|nr:DUF1292 domain-containing protein [Lachnospiraceae bacterium]
MEKTKFDPASDGTSDEFYIIAQTTANGRTYLLVTDEDPEGEGEGEAFILRDDSAPEDADALYTPIEDDAEYAAVSEIFRAILEEDEIDLEDQSV